MSGRRTLKAIHLAGTAWFVLCIGYVLVLALRQAGFHWWVIFSLSGHSALVVFLLVSVYFFAVFKGVSRTQGIEIEHPLTSTGHYLLFYAVAPFLGGLSGCLAMIGENRAGQFLEGIALGTFATTFLVWVVIDPLVGSLEPVLIPPSRKHRGERFAQAKAEREKKRKERQQLLAVILAKEQADRQNWRQLLKPQAERLASLLRAGATNVGQAERQAVDIGLSAWQLGGITCMRELHDMALAMSKQRSGSETVADFISFWWDGIGTWRSPSIDQIAAYSV
jgi:hypothetical protein